MYTCRECEKPVNQATEVCPYCGADLETLQTEAEPAKPGSAAKRIIVWGTMIAAVWAFLWFILPERSMNVAAQSEVRGLELATATREALRTHAEAHGSYPATLDGLTRSALAGVREAAQRAQTEGYRLEYIAGPPGEGGNVQTYSVTVRPGNHSFRGFFVNESGVIRWTRENRPATAQDNPI